MVLQLYFIVQKNVHKLSLKFSGLEKKSTVASMNIFRQSHFEFYSKSFGNECFFFYLTRLVDIHCNRLKEFTNEQVTVFYALHVCVPTHIYMQMKSDLLEAGCECLD